MTFQRGNRHARKLEGEDVLTIRERYATERGVTQGALAREFGVSVNTIRSIVNYETWQNVALGPPERKPPPDKPPPVATQDEIAASFARAAALAEQPKPQAPEGSWYDQPPPYEEPPLSPGARAKFEAAMKTIKVPIAEQTSEALGELLTVDSTQKGDQK